MTVNTLVYSSSFDYEFQGELLQIILNDGEFVYNYSDCINPEFFTFEEYKILSGLALSFYKKGDSLSISQDSFNKALTDYFEKHKINPEFRSKVRETYKKYGGTLPKNPAYIKDQIVEWGTLAVLRRVGMEFVSLLRSSIPPEQRKKSLRRAQELIQEASLIGSSKRHLDRTIPTEIDSVESSVLRIRSKLKRSGLIPTPFKILNERSLHGGLGAGQIGVVQAYLGTGKSLTLVIFGVAALEAGKNVLHITIGDLDEEDVELRYLCAQTRLSTGEILGHNEDEKVVELVEKEMLKLKNKRGGIGDSRIVSFPPGETTVTDIEQYLVKLKQVENFSPDLVLLDYADNLRLGRDFSFERDQYAKMGIIYKKLITIAKKYEFALWTASQVQREGQIEWKRSNQVMDSEHTANSIQKMNDADIVLSLNVKDVADDNRDSSKMLDNVLDVRSPRAGEEVTAYIFVSKVRRGLGRYLIKTKFNRARCFFHMPDDIDTIEDQREQLDGKSPVHSYN